MAHAEAWLHERGCPKINLQVRAGNHPARAFYHAIGFQTDEVGSLGLWSMAIKPGRPVAMGVIAGTPFIGLPGNPVASFVTFAYVVRATILALSGAAPEPLIGLPVRAAFTYKKKKGRREYVRASLRYADDGSLEAVKFPREGAGLLSSLADTDGIIELAEDAERVSPGESVRFLAYPILL
jgi:molybdopterin molybdotransferase